MSHDSVNVLWTGGWDSTFQLLLALLSEQKEVTPIYIIDPERKSIRHELLAMNAIKALVFKTFPECKPLLKNTLFYDRNDYPADETIMSSYKVLKESHQLGSQYPWLVAFCKEQNISKIQLGIDKGSLFDKMFKDYGDDSRFTTFIKHFSFPIIHLSKQDMYNIAQENKWLDIMKLTWFCHKPKKNSPCGKCNPCKSVINEGMSWRIPKTRLLLRHF